MGATAQAKKLTETRKVFNSWLRLKSPNSKEHYTRVVTQFFDMVNGKSIDDLNVNDLEHITKSTVVTDYTGVLLDNGINSTTILNYLSAVRSYVKALRDNRVFQEDFLDYDYCLRVALTEKELKKTATPRTNMASDDIDAFTDWLATRFTGRNEDKGAKYQLVLKFMSITAVRVDATFSKIHWNNIKKEKDSYGNKGWVVYALDKGAKLNRKPISDEFYTELYETLYNGNDEDLVFGDVSKQMFTRLMSEFSKSVGETFTPHSIKVGAGTRLYRMTKDIYQVSKFLDHNSVEMTRKYIRVDDDMSQAGSFILSSNISVDNLESLDYDVLVDIIKNRQDLTYMVLNEAKKRGDI